MGCLMTKNKDEALRNYPVFGFEMPVAKRFAKPAFINI
jgi:hypothetical protein